MNNSGYQQGSSASGAPASGGAVSTADHGKLKRQYLAYIGDKSEEIKEQKDARRYYHAAQHTGEQTKVLNKRRQPVVTYNRVGRKINAVIGLLERQRQDPRGFPRTPKHEEGAEIATAVLRYVMDQQEWPAKSPMCGLNGAVDGIGGIELLLEQGDEGDVEVGFGIADPSSFFYDPRSLQLDFSDARYMGTGKWADLDTVVEMFPEHEEALRASLESGSDLTSNPDSDSKWFTDSDAGKRIRLVDHWYMKSGKWHWCLYTGTMILAEGESPFVDEKGKTICRYIMFSANVDHDGDRYGFVRNMRSAQDEINQRRSKGLHQLNSRRLIISSDNQDKAEEWRREAARPDGVLIYPAGTTPPEFDDAAKGNELTGQLAFLEDAKNEIENYGFNPALMGSGVSDMSGRAIQLQQQAGIAELGPYLLAYKGWKLRVYRAIWNAVQMHWSGQRWIRVTDDDNAAEFFAINEPQIDQMTGLPAIDPATGQPILSNQINALDVDIIIDEGPDTITMQSDAYDTLTVMARGGQQLPPEVLIELSPLTGSVKKRIIDKIEAAKEQAAQASQPGPVQQQAIMLDMKGKEADIAKVVADTGLSVAKTEETRAKTAGEHIDQQVAVIGALKPDPPPQQQQPIF